MSSSIDRLDEHRSPASRHPAGVVHRDLAMVLLKCDTLSEKTELEAVRTRIHLWEAYSLYGQLAEAAPLVDEAIMERHINVQITGACAKGRVARAREVLASLPPAMPASFENDSRHQPSFPDRCIPVFRQGGSVNGFLPVGGNSADLMTDSNSGIDAMVVDMDAAADHIHLVCKRPYIFAPVPASNKKALAFDLKVGFKEVARLPSRYIEGEDVIYLRLAQEDNRWVTKESKEEAA